MRASSKGLTALQVWEKLSDYTLTINTATDNDTTYVTVQDITGSGILVSCGSKVGNTTVNTAIKITIDGGTPIEITDPMLSGLANTGSPLILLQGFKTSCKVEMKLGAAHAATYWSLALVE